MSHPERLGKYPIAGVLGQGAMGVVYKAFDPVIHRPVAIKTIQKSLIEAAEEGADIAARFRNEAQAVGRLSHPGIVQIYEYGEDDATAYIAMEFVEGVTLEKLLRSRPGRLPEAEALSIVDQLLDALECAHRAGVWHRDVKPANLLVTAEGRVKLTDFGIARIESLALTKVASMIGTPGYMAPEQYIGEGMSHRVDLFAAGVLLYRLLTGVAPFSGGAETVMYKILHEDPPPPSATAGGGVAPFYDAVVARALAKKPDARFASAAEFRQALGARGTPMVPSRPPADDDATVVVSAPVDWTTGANAAAVAEVEKALATVMGPVAKAIVRKAARTCSDVDSLRLAVAQHIPDEREREQFVSGARPAAHATRTLFMPRTSSRTSPPTPVPVPTHPPAASGASPRLTEAMTAAALPMVVEVVGPIAKVLVKKAAAQSATKAQFIQALADAVDAADRDRLLAALRQL